MARREADASESTRLNDMLLRLRKGLAATAIALGTSSLLAWLDSALGHQLNMGILYLVPVSLSAWYAGVTPAAMVAAASVTVWQLAGEALPATHAPTKLQVANVVIQLALYTSVAFLVGYLKKRFSIVEWSSRHDALTGLPNARAFYERADEELARARRYDKPITAAYIDLDNFKLLNDRHGHRAGDAALRVVAALMRASGRASDISARLGGDEFVMLMPETDADGALVVLERLRKELERGLENCPSLVSASIGAVAFSEAPESVEQLLHAADACMYAVKRNGKNLVRVEQALPHTNTTPHRSA